MPARFTLSLLLLVVALSGCKNGRFTYLDHQFEVDEHNLTLGTLDDSKGQIEIDLNISGYAYDERLFYSEIIRAIDAHPGLKIRNFKASGKEAFRAPRYKKQSPAPMALKLALCHQFYGHWYNYFLGFPGMVIICGTWLGYYYELDLDLSGEITRSNGDVIDCFKASHRIDFREKNAPRSIAFHYWPTNGVLGTQFALGVFMSLDLIN